MRVLAARHQRCDAFEELERAPHLLASSIRFNDQALAHRGPCEGTDVRRCNITSAHLPAKGCGGGGHVHVRLFSVFCLVFVCGKDGQLRVVTTDCGGTCLSSCFMFSTSEQLENR